MIRTQSPAKINQYLKDKQIVSKMNEQYLLTIEYIELLNYFLNDVSKIYVVTKK